MAEDKIKKIVSERLSEAQKNKEFKDTSHEINYTKKYKRSFDVVTANNLEEIESDPINAYKQVVKNKVWIEYNVEEQKQKGYSSGATYFKVELRKSLSSRPFDSKDAREVYVKNITNLISILDGCFTAEQCQTEARDFITNKDFYLGDVTEINSSKWDASRKLRKKMESIFGVRFINFCKRNSDSAAKAWNESILYDPYSKEQQDEYVLKMLSGAEKTLEQAKIKLKEASEKDKPHIIQQIRSKHSSFFPTRKSFDDAIAGNFDEMVKLYLSGYERYVSQSQQRVNDLINRENLRAEYNVRLQNWDWSSVVKEQTKRTETKAPKINTKLPLHYINRVGGYEIPSVSTESIVSKFCFNNVVFGNALKDEESREHVRHFLGALTDLADILNIDICKVNQLGKLDINFATMGIAGHAATYFPSYKAINLSKNSGDGSVAHEWYHYADNCIAEGDVRRASNNFASEGGMVSKNALYYAIEALKNYIYKGDGEYVTVIKQFLPQSKVRYHAYSETLEGCISEIQRIYPTYAKASQSKSKSVVNYYGFLAHKFKKEYIDVPMKLDTTLFYFNSSSIGTKYWIESAELFARSFEAYIEYKLDKLGRKNNYLVSYKNNWENSRVGLEGMPYPQGKELEKIAVLYDNIFDEFKKEFQIGDFVPFTDKRTSEYIEVDKKEPKKRDAKENINENKNTDMVTMVKEPENIDTPKVGDNVYVHFRKEKGIVKEVNGNFITIEYPKLDFSEAVNSDLEKIDIIEGDGNEIVLPSGTITQMEILGRNGFSSIKDKFGTTYYEGFIKNEYFNVQYDNGDWNFIKPTGLEEDDEQKIIDWIENEDLHSEDKVYKDFITLRKSESEIQSDKDSDKHKEKVKIDNRRMIGIIEALQTTPNLEEFDYKHKAVDLITNFRKITTDGRLLGVTTGIAANGHIISTFTGTPDEVKKELGIEEEDESEMQSNKEVTSFGGFKVGQKVHTHLNDNTYEIVEFKDTDKSLQAKAILKPIDVVIAGKHTSGEGFDNSEVLISDLKFETIVPEGIPVGYQLGDKYKEDFDADGLLKKASEVDMYWSTEDMSKLYESLEDMNYHTLAGSLYNLIDSIMFGNDKDASIELLNTFLESVKSEIDFQQEDGGESFKENVNSAKENINDALSLYEKEKNRINGNKVGDLLYGFFSDYVIREPKELAYILEVNKKLASAYKFQLSVVKEDISQWKAFNNSLESKNLTIWDIIPEELKVVKKQNKLSFEPTHTDKNLIEITKGFVGKDDIRLIMEGVHFDEHGIVATDAHKMIFIPSETQQKGTYCVTKQCFKDTNNINPVEEVGYTYPKYQQIIPASKEWFDVDLESLYLYTNTLIKADVLNLVTELIILKFGEQKAGFKASFLLECINAMRKLGHSKASIGITDSSRPFIFVRQGNENNHNIQGLKTQFCLLMPMMINETHDDLFYFDIDTESFVQNGIEISLKTEDIKLNNIKKEIQKEISKKEAEIQKEKETNIVNQKFIEQVQQENEALKLSSIPKIVKAFMPEMQQKAIVGNTELSSVIEELKSTIEKMPMPYGTEGQETSDKIAYLHYFSGSSDWYILERDSSEAQHQAFGFTILNGDMQNAEFGYISIEELKATNKVELDFYFEPTTLNALYPERFPIKEVVKEKPTVEDLKGRIMVINRMIAKGKGDKSELEGRIMVINRMIAKYSKVENNDGKISIKGFKKINAKRFNQGSDYIYQDKKNDKFYSIDTEGDVFEILNISYLKEIRDFLDSKSSKLEKGGEVGKADEFSYMMLGRLQSDCDYFLGNGGRSERSLWAGNVKDQIKEMKRLWNSIPEGQKPEWLSMEDILDYEKKMSNDDSKEDLIVNGYSIRWNEMFGGWYNVRHLESNDGEDFKTKEEAIEYAEKG